MFPYRAVGIFLLLYVIYLLVEGIGNIVTGEHTMTRRFHTREIAPLTSYMFVIFGILGFVLCLYWIIKDGGED